MPHVSVTVHSRAALGERDMAAMYGLLHAYYADTSVTRFRADLAEKTHVILLHAGSTLCGFSTLAVLESPSVEVAAASGVQGLAGARGTSSATGPVADYRALFSGDTIIHHNHRGEQGLALAFCHLAGQIKAQQPGRPLYWFLISKGYRTYRYLHLFSKTYWPGYRQTSETGLQPLLAALAQHKFGDCFDPATGIVEFPQSHGHLRPGEAQIRPHLLARPEVAYFVQRNPHYARGTELACITLLDADNLRSVAQRAFVAGFNQAVGMGSDAGVDAGEGFASHAAQR